MSHSDQQPQKTGWDFGAVNAFKAVFRMAADAVYAQTVVRAQKRLEGFGMKLSEEQTQKLGGHALKLGQSMLVPIPAKDLILDLELLQIDTTVSGYAVSLSDVKLQGAEAWIYNFASWEGPTLLVRSFEIGSISLARQGVTVTGSLALKGLKVQGEGGNVLDVIATCYAGALNSVVDAEIAADNQNSGGLAVTPPAEVVQRQVTALVKSQLGTVLKAGAKAEIESLAVEVLVQYGQNVGGAKVALEGASVSGKLDGGGVEFSMPKGGAVVDLGGAVTTTNAGLTVEAVVEAEAVLNADMKLLVVGKLDVEFNVTGAYSGTPATCKGSIKIVNLGLIASTGKDSLLECIVGACGMAAMDLYAGLIGTDPGGMQAQLAITLGERIKAVLATSLTTRLKAGFDSIVVKVDAASYGQMGMKGTLNASNVNVDLDIAPDQPLGVSFEGEIDAEKIIVAWAQSRLINITSIEIGLDASGNGEVTGELILHGKEVAKFADSKLLRFLMDADDPISFKAPVAGYQLALGKIEIKIPNHKLVEFGVGKFVLDNIRVSNQGQKTSLIKGTRASIPPTLKTPLTADKTGADLGELPTSSGTDRILTPRQEGGDGAQGAINLRAWAQNVLQGKLDALLR